MKNPALEPEARVEHYRILSPLGVGGMGEVYLAEDTQLERQVALKVLLPEVAYRPDRLQRFIREAKAASALNHPNILTVHQIGSIGASKFIATEFVDGETLRQRLLRSPLAVAEALGLATQMAAALAAAHAAGIVHRDIKPENVMIRRDGIVKVLDFGLAKLVERDEATGSGGDEDRLTRAGSRMGTVAYMSPEQTRGEPLDGRSDLFSLGIVLYEMLTGRRPFTGETDSHVAVAILEREPLPPSRFLADAPGRLDSLISGLLAKVAARRYADAGTLLLDLKTATREVEDASESDLLPALGGAGAGSEWGDSEETHSVVGLDTAELPAARPKNSIAVLPFANISADPENEYFCDGLAEELSSGLARLEDLKVVARTSAFSFRDRDLSASSVGEALNVGHLLEGSVRRAQNRVRISVRLVDTVDGFHVWSDRYDRQIEDIFEVQDEITLAVVETLRLKLLGPERAAAIKHGTEDPDAYQAYLQARFFWNKRTPAALRTAARYCRQAIEHDPSYARAYAGLAGCYVLYPWLSVEPPRESMPKARAAALTAIEIDETVSEAHAVLGVYLSFYEWNQPASERSIRRALELKPNAATAMHWLGNVPLLAMGKFEESIAAVRKAQELDPLSPIIASDLGLSYYYARRVEEAVAAFERALQLDTGFYVARYHLGQARHLEGRFDEAVEEYRRCLAADRDPWVEALLARSLAATGQSVEATTLLDELQTSAEEGRYVPYVGMAVALAALDRVDEAFEWLERDIDDRSLYPAFYAVDPVFDQLRDHPRFADVLLRVEQESASGVA